MNRRSFLQAFGGVMGGFVAWSRVGATPAGPADAGARTHDLLVTGIRERRVLTFAYHGFARTVEPHAYGQNAKNEGTLLAFQTGGGSASEPPPGWRTFVVTEIVTPTLEGTTFSKPRPDYRRGQPGWTSVHAEL